MKICTKCKRDLPILDFTAARGGKFGVRSVCKECTRQYNLNKYVPHPKEKVPEKTRKYNSDYYYSHREEVIRKTKERVARLKLEMGESEYSKLVCSRANKSRRDTKIKFLEMYGNRCSCCGEENKKFLTIEHLLGQHNSPRRDGSLEAYRKALAKYEPEIYTILCWNCNCGKSTNGGVCPHREEFQ